MTRQDIEKELKELNNRLDKAEIYFKTLDHCEVDDTKEYKTLKKIIKRMSSKFFLPFKNDISCSFS